MSDVIFILDLLGSAAFAVSGAIVATRRGLDLFGVIVLSFVTATGGGIIRDLLLGTHPPLALQNMMYLAVATAAGVTTFYTARWILKYRAWLEIFDAIGLGLFTVTGTSLGLSAGIEPFAAALLGVTTGCGGGALRDVLAARVPSVLREDIYALACLLGAGVMLALEFVLQVPRPVAALIAAPLITITRLIAWWRGWQLPVGRLPFPDEPR